MKYVLALSVLTCGTSLSAQKPTWTEPPRLVVGIIVDQMRADYIYRYWNNYGEGGFKRMVNEGAFLRDAHFDYIPTKTAPGHASVYTGTTPARHGIVANDMYVRSTGAIRYCVSAADTIHAVGVEDRVGRRSPENLIATTISDELERRTDGLAKTIGISLKDRGAILPIGRTGDAAYWFAGGTDGAFVTSTWYMDTLPAWLQRFNGERLAASYLGRNWDLLLPESRYHQALPDENRYEMPLPGATTPTLPQNLQALFKANGSTSTIIYTPWANSLTTDLALAALVGEELGADPITDLLAVSYSGPDNLAHRTGPRALEMEDTYLRLDLDLERLFAELDRRVGKGRYTVFLTADHGGPDVPQYIQDQKGSAGYVHIEELKAYVEAGLAPRFGAGPWIRRTINEQIFLNDSLMKVRNILSADIQRATADILLTYPLVVEAITATDLARLDHSSGIRRMLQRGFMPQRSGDVLFAYRPGYFEPDEPGPYKGVEHESGWNYNTHVPVLFFGRGVVHKQVDRRISITDIAPTVALITGMTMPDAATGTAVVEILAP